METVRVSFKTDAEIKELAAETYGRLGIDMTTAYNAFLRKSIACGGFPFDVRLSAPNEVTVKAIQNVEAGRNLSKRFSSVDSLMEDLNA